MSTMFTFKLIPYYTGKRDLDEIVRDKKSSSILWLEILLNDGFDWERYLDIKEVRTAYDKACVWYGHFSTIIKHHINRKPLRTKKGRIDEKEYRRFIEALNFVTS